MSETPKKIIIDEDWKQEAQQEKEALEAKLELEKQAQSQPMPNASLLMVLIETPWPCRQCSTLA